jgi:predicted RNase H-like HicB family nuclease/DNA-binding XRE family transcriptional regulator
MKYHFKIYKESDGFWAQCIELSGCMTQGDSIEELNKNMEEALNLYIEEPESSEKLVPFPDDSISKSRNVVAVPVNPSIAFAFLVRHNRLKRGLTQKEAAKKLGLENLYSYQRLENKKCNPTLKIIFLLKKIYPDFSVDQALSC